MLITAHAACKGHAPENTLAGIDAALRLKADSIEIDLHVTRDGTPVLLHDATVDRTTDGEGTIAGLSLRKARSLSIRDGSGSVLRLSKDVRIPTLREVLAAVDRRAQLVLEVKAEGIEEQVLAVVRRAKAIDWCVVHSFYPTIVERFRTLEPRLAASYLLGREVRDWDRFLGFALSLGAQGVSVHEALTTPERVRATRLRELRYTTWTVNKRADVRRVAAAGVDAITTDYPDRVRRWLPKGA